MKFFIGKFDGKRQNTPITGRIVNLEVVKSFFNQKLN